MRGTLEGKIAVILDPEIVAVTGGEILRNWKLFRSFELESTGVGTGVDVTGEEFPGKEKSDFNFGLLSKQANPNASSNKERKTFIVYKTSKSKEIFSSL